ncbi:glycosyltransferase [Hungatella sp. L12]|uniref:Glycosyltransferase n=1 Tax=Hungatella hominis TaxID=2763050 RepID=A0ABR7HBJ2_9FIRM|nr:glycosyltransferase [Hungatella hominis]MBC5710554.1 glycosyltransferase [Hungatella hominis]
MIPIKEKLRELKNPPGKIDVNEIYDRLVPYKYVSFDIFDTLIKRKVNTPVDIFKIMELSVGDNFVYKRIEAERKARENSAHEEVTLQEIYDHYPEKNSGYAKKELEIELDTIVPNIPMLEVYRRCVADGKKIFITTDMYWPIASIKNLLKQVCVDKYEKLYLSSEEQKTKKTGSLFKEILKEQNIRPEELIHIGDHPQSDYKVPRNIGIAAIQIPRRTKEIQFREKLEGLQNNYLNSLIKNTYTGDQDAYYEFGYAQFGKLLWGYSRWIHQKTVEKGISELFFFARDGWIMKQAYDICFADPTIHTHYLEVSRRSLRGPNLWMDFHYDKVLDMVVNAKLISIRSIFDGLGLEIDNYKEQLSDLGITKDTVYDRSTIRDDEKLKYLILSLEKEIVSNSKIEYDALNEYLKTNGISGKFGIIDIGYAGSMQRYLQQTLNQLGIAYEISGFYLAVADYYTKNDSVDNPLDLNGYLFDFKHDPSAVDTRSSYVGLFETLFLEQDGSVKRYIQVDEGVKAERYPYEYYREGKPTQDFLKIKSLQQGAMDFVKAAAADKNLERFDYSVDDLFYGIYESGVNPDKHDLELFSEIEFYDEGITAKLAAPKSLMFYLGHVNQLKRDFLSCRWKIGFMKKLFKINLPYQKMYQKLKRVESE